MPKRETSLARRRCLKPLSWATPPSSKRLLKAGADPDSPGADGQTALMIVARTSNVAAARILIEHGAHVNAAEQQREQTALMWAAAESQPAMVRELIAHGADVNAHSHIYEDLAQVSSEPRALHQSYGGLTADALRHSRRLLHVCRKPWWMPAPS